MAEKQQLYGFVTRLPKDERELNWKTTGFQGFNPEGSYQYEFSDHVGWKQPVFTKLDAEFFVSRPNDYKFEAVAGRDSRPVRPKRDEVTQKIEEDLTTPAAPVDEPKPAFEVPKLDVSTPSEPERIPKRTGRPPKSKVEAIGV